MKTFTSDRTCVSCDQPLGDNHKCSVRHEAARKAAQTRFNNETFLSNEPARLPVATRLYAGLQVLENVDR